MQTELKPFDLQKALAGEPVMTREGTSVTIAGFNNKANMDEELLGWVSTVSCCWSPHGKISTLSESDHPWDLFMK